MRWFQHDTHAHLNVKIQLLIEKEGLAGAGAFWSLLEEIGLRSSEFRIRIDEPRGLLARLFDRLVRRGQPDPPPKEIPVLTLSVLSHLFRTRPTRLRRIIRTCVCLGLFDREEWERWGVLFSRGFEGRADAYTKRSQRESHRVSESVRTLCAHSPELAAQCPKSSPPEQNREQQIDIYKNKTAEQDVEPKIEFGGAEASAKRSVFRIGAGGDTDMDRLYGGFIGKMNGFLGDWAARHGGTLPWPPEHESPPSLWREIRAPPAYLSASLIGTPAGTRPLSHPIVFRQQGLEPGQVSERIVDRIKPKLPDRHPARTREKVFNQIESPGVIPKKQVCVGKPFQVDLTEHPWIIE